MSMTPEEVIKQFESLLAHCESMRSDDDLTWDDDCEALKIALSALRPVSRERVEKVWRGEWIKKDGYTECSKCEYWYDSPENEDDGDRLAFCPNCGAPMTDKAVQMVMERLEALHEKT